jgi:hypothetical protein
LTPETPPVVSGSVDERLALAAAPPVLPSLPGGDPGRLVAAFPVALVPWFVPFPVRVSDVPLTPVFPGETCPGGRRVELLGCAAVPEDEEPVEGDAEEDEPPALPPLLEPPEDPCAHAAPAIRQLAIRAVEMVR